MSLRGPRWRWSGRRGISLRRPLLLVGLVDMVGSGGGGGGRGLVVREGRLGRGEGAGEEVEEGAGPGGGEGEGAERAQVDGGGGGHGELARASPFSSLVVGFRRRRDEGRRNRRWKMWRYFWAREWRNGGSYGLHDKVVVLGPVKGKRPMASSQSLYHRQGKATIKVMISFFISKKKK